MNYQSTQQTCKSPKTTVFANSMINWWSEIAGAFIALACVAATFGILLDMNNTPLRKWTLPIQINALVSVLMTLSKTTMLFVVAQCISQLKWIYFEGRPQPLFDIQLFDAASRGPLGSAILLWSLRYRAVLASLGASITIISLAMDPFAQQVIDFPTRTSNYTMVTPDLRIANAFVTPDISIKNRDLLELSPSLWMMNNAVSLAVANGTQQHEYFDCPSTLCEWPAYRTLGLCSRCADLTIQTKVSCNLFDAYDAKSYTVAECNWTTPNNVTMNAGWYSLSEPTVSLISDLKLNNSTSLVRSDPHSGRSEVTTSAPAYPMANLTVLKIDTLSSNYSLTNDTIEPQPTVWGCELYWCEKAFNESTCAGGKLQEKLLGSVPLHFDCPNNTNAEDVSSSDLCNAYPLEDPRAPLFPGAENLTWSPYIVSLNDYRAIASSLKSFFNRNRLSVSEINAPDNYTNMPIATSLYYLNQGNINKTMQAVTKAMTDQMRLNANGTALAGLAYFNETYVHVAWPWFVLPVIATCSAIGLLVATTFIASHLDRDEAWKDSTIALMFHGLRHAVELHGDILTTKCIEKEARRIEVQLRLNVDGKTIGLEPAP